MTLNGFLLFLVLTFATFRLAELVVFDAGPFQLFIRLRVWTGLYDTNERGAAPFQNANAFQKWLGGVLDCPYCAGVYFAFLGALVWLLLLSLRGELAQNSAVELVLLFSLVWLGLAGLQSAIETVAGRSGKV